MMQEQSEQITAFDSRDQTYPIGKLDAHRRNIPHLAVSIFVLRGEELLLQKRAATKYHSGGLWANTVCSHPRWQENVDSCAARRIPEELGWQVPLKRFACLDYSADVGGGLFENERVYCYCGTFDEASCDIRNFNREEVSDVNWATLPDIDERMRCEPQTFTQWFRIYMTQHRALMHSILDHGTKVPEVDTARS